MNSEKQAALQAEKKKKRLRFAGLVILTILVVAAVIITALSVKSCEEKINLDLGQPYDAGKATVTVSDLSVKSIADSEMVYAIVTVKVETEKDFTLDPSDFALDGTPPMNLKLADGTEVTTEKTEIVAGQTKDVKIAFMVKRSMAVSFLTYKKAVIRLGSMTENDNNLSKE